MPSVRPHDLFARAQRDHFALGAFNTSNLEVTQAIAEALQEAQAPGIIQTSEGAIGYAGLVTLRDIIRNVAASVAVPIVLHLDHGKSFESVAACIEVGYPSVMIDGSTLPLTENIALTKRVTALAHRSDVWVEGEVGAILGKEGLRGRGMRAAEDLFTRPDEAAQFVAETGVDALAVSVGTIHGSFRGAERVRFERLAEIQRAVSVPLVLHGGSGLPAEDIRRAIPLGIAKVNIDTELREAFHDALQEHTEEATDHSIDPRALLTPARDAVRRAVIEKVRLLGSAGRAREKPQ